MQSLSTLIKLQKTRVDEQRLVLARAQEKLDLVERAIAGLENEKRHEKEVAGKNTEQAVTYGAFLKEAVKRERALFKERQIAVAAVNAARETLIELFEEQKRYEIAEAARLEAEEREELRRDTAELDEIGGVTHERRKNR
jgi:hypothetical protein